MTKSTAKKPTSTAADLLAQPAHSTKSAKSTRIAKVNTAKTGAALTLALKSIAQNTAVVQSTKSDNLSASVTAAIKPMDSHVCLKPNAATKPLALA